MTNASRYLGIALTFIALAGCATHKAGSSKAKKEVDVTAEQMSAPARATLTKVTAGGKVDKVTREVERGKTVYDVEATVGGKHMEYLISHDNGEVLGTEVPIEYSDLPAPVRAAAEKHFGTSSGLKAMKGVEYGETQYEIVGKKDGKTAEVTYDPTGKRVP